MIQKHKFLIKSLTIDVENVKLNITLSRKKFKLLKYLELKVNVNITIIRSNKIFLEN